MANLSPYEEFSGIYDTRWGQFSLRYIPFLEALCGRCGLEPRSILDLACGTGTLLAALAREDRRLTGLDISPQMLAAARRNCAGPPGIDLQLGDFRAFDIHACFDLILCCFDSLNYLDRVEELDDVFRCVAGHLAAGGLFVFDVVNDIHCRRVAGHSESWVVNGVEFTDTNTYDPVTRVQEIALGFPTGVERHHRVPLEHEDVVAAAVRSGLRVAEAYASLGMAPVEPTSERIFFVVAPGQV